MTDFETFTKISKNVGDVGKLIVGKDFKKLPKVQKNCPIWSHSLWPIIVQASLSLPHGISKTDLSIGRERESSDVMPQKFVFLSTHATTNYKIKPDDVEISPRRRAYLKEEIKNTFYSFLHTYLGTTNLSFDLLLCWIPLCDFAVTGDHTLGTKLWRKVPLKRSHWPLGHPNQHHQFLATNFITKVAKIFVKLFGLFEKHHF